MVSKESDGSATKVDVVVEKVGGSSSSRRSKGRSSSRSRSRGRSRSSIRSRGNSDHHI